MSPEDAAIRPKNARKNKWARLARKNGISASTFYGRLRRKWTEEKAATQPVRPKGTHNKWVEIAENNGIYRQLYYMRVISLKWSKEKAATHPIRYRKTDESLYMIYEGDEWEFTGTLRECAEYTGLSMNYIRWLTTPSGMKSTEGKDNATRVVKVKEDKYE